MKRSLNEKIARYSAALAPFIMPGEFRDQGEKVTARLLIQFLVPMMLFSPLFAAVSIISVPSCAWRWLSLLSFSTAVIVTTFMILRTGRARLASGVMLSGYWVIITIYALTAGGVTAPIIAGYLLLVLSGGFLLGAKTGYVVAFVSILTESSFLIAGEFLDMNSSTFKNDDLLVLIVNVFFALIVAILQHVASHNFRLALSRADNELAERTLTEASLRQSEERYSRLSQATFEGIIVSENDLIADANNQALSMFGCASEEMIGRKLGEFLEIDTRPLSSGLYGQFESIAVRRDGTTFPVETRYRSLNFDGHDMRLTTVRDVSERWQADLLQNAVYMISQAPDKSASLDELYERVHEIVKTVMPANDFYIALNDEANGGVTFPYLVEEMGEMARQKVHGTGPAAYVIRTGKPLMCDKAAWNALVASGEIPALIERPAIWIGVPLKADDRTFGVMAVQHGSDRNAFGEREFKMLEYVSEQVARAIDRKRAEDASQRERILLRTLVDNLPTPICVKDREHRRTLVNPAYVRHLCAGVDREDLRSEEALLGKTDFDIFPSTMAEVHFREDDRIIRDGTQILDREEYRVGPDGTPHWNLLSKIPMRDENGEITGLVGIASDITHQKMAEEDLRQAHAFNEMLIKTFPFGIEIDGDDGTILFMSEWMKTLVGYDAVGKKCCDVYMKENQKSNMCPLIGDITVGESKSIEVSGALNGRTFLINHTGLLYKGRKALLKVIQDITENKRLQAQFLQAQKLEGLGTLAAGIAHDFNNILGVILGHAELLRGAASTPAKERPGINAIVASALRGKSLVGQLLMFARKTESTFQPVNLGHIVMEVESLLKETFPKTIQFTENFTDDLPPIKADPNQLHQVLLNICVNARDAMPFGGTLSISLDTVSREYLAAKHNANGVSKYIRLEIRDTGMGMDDETRARIFEPFFSTKGIGKGTGLGLAVVYGIIESHHGFVEVKSEKGKGTAFSIFFPADEECAIGHLSLKESAPVPKGGTETILVIEDEEMLRELAETMLTSSGYKVILAADGHEGVETFRANKERIGAVLSDIGLPRLSGEDVVRKIKEIDPGAKVVIASGFISPDMKNGFEKLGVKSFVQKPYTIRDVLGAVRWTIDAA